MTSMSVVERLAVRPLAVAPTGFEQVASLLRQRDGGCVAVESNNLDEPGLTKMPQLAIARVQRPLVGVAKVVGRHDAKGADRRERARLRAAKGVDVVSMTHVFSIEAARQVDVLHEDIAWVSPLTLARIRTSPAASAEVARAVFAVARIVAPAWIVAIQHGDPPFVRSDHQRLKYRKREGALRHWDESEGELPTRSARGQNGDNLAQFRVGGGCPPPSNFLSVSPLLGKRPIGEHRLRAIEWKRGQPALA